MKKTTASASSRRKKKTYDLQLYVDGQTPKSIEMVKEIPQADGK